MTLLFHPEPRRVLFLLRCPADHRIQVTPDQARQLDGWPCGKCGEPIRVYPLRLGDTVTREG